MHTIYIYILDTLADWEIGYLMAELNSKRFFKKDSQSISIKMVSCDLQPITTMGGLKIEPNCVVEDIIMSNKTVLILPGADTWSHPKHQLIIKKAKDLLQIDAAVCAICGATVALAEASILDERLHTSNGDGFLQVFAPHYKGKDFYRNQLSIKDNNLITAGSAGSLLWTKQIIEYLNVFNQDTLTNWYNYFNTGEAGYFYAMMQTLS